jgi:ABC-type transport system substrate-binding protein
MTDRGWRPDRHPRSLFRRGRATSVRRAALLAVLLVVLLAGCTPPGLPAAVAPAPSSGSGPPQPAEPAVTIGVDGQVHGFNPHAIADYSPAAAAVAQLVLPSVSSVQSDGTSRLNRDVVQSAVVSATDPFTVTYTLDRDAAWSDGTPITAEDFSYLRDQMLIQPGTVDPAGYRLITGIVSRDAGKSVDVTFSQAVTDWQTLFSPLLPAHILKDSPGGWTQGLAGGLPVSGGRYKMQAYDQVTGEITLVRNDKYWGTPPGPSTAVIRIGADSALIEALRRGDVQAVLLQPDAADQQLLEHVVPADRLVRVPLPGTVQLVFNTATGPTSDPAVRRAIAGSLDVNSIRMALDGGNVSGGAAVTSLVELPDPAGSATGALVGGGTAAAMAALSAAGFRRESLYLVKGGATLTLRLTYDSTDARTAAAARLVQSQLAGIGIEVDLVRESPLAAINEQLATGSADLGLVFLPRSSSTGLAAASAFDCPAVASGTRADESNVVARTGNLSGFCSTEIQPLLERLTAAGPVAGLDRQLIAALPVLPISRPTAVFAASAAITAKVRAAGSTMHGAAPFAGPINSLSDWPAN